MKREQKKNIEKLGKELEEKKKLPKEIREKINSKVFINMAILALIIIYFAALNFLMGNIPTDIYINSLQVLSIMLLIITLIVFEYGYKKDDGEIWMHGVEVMIIGIFTIYLKYLYSIYFARYGIVLLIAGIVFLIYYAIKILLIQRRVEKEYNKSLTDINEIVK